MTDASGQLERARELLQQYEYAAAMQCCELALARAPLDADLSSDAHELLGISCMTLGRAVEGISHLRQAATHVAPRASVLLNLASALVANGEPSEGSALLVDAIGRFGPSPSLLYNLALAQQAAHDTVSAIESYRRCLQLAPGFAEAHNNLGSALYKCGEVEQAVACFRAALAAKPDYVRALTNLGNALRRLRRSTEAEEALRRALMLAPQHVPALCNLGQLLLEERRAAEALTSFGQALALQPALAEGLRGLGAAQSLLGEHTSALESFDRALASSPDEPELHLYRGRALQALDRHAEALACYQRALERASSADAWTCHGFALGALGRYAEAVDSYERALDLEPDFVAARWNQALLCLLLGDLSRGWELFEARFELVASQPPPQAAACPPWRGNTSLEGRRIWVRPEVGDGFGDVIQFGRYVHLLERLGAEVVLEVRPSLIGLMRTLGPRVRVIATGEAPGPIDCHCPLLSLPLAFGTDLGTIPAGAPYLKADAARAAHWAQRLGAADGLRVGIAWRGETRHDRWVLKGRSVPLQCFEALLAVAGVHLVSLQKGEGCDELATVGFRARITDFGASLDEGPDAFLDTAAIMTHLDLVISIDSAIAHLAGALGVPVWLALKNPPDWRWLLDRTDSPWYPSMRLFRQRHPGDWSTVFASMAAELACLRPRP